MGSAMSPAFQSALPDRFNIVHRLKHTRYIYPSFSYCPANAFKITSRISWGFPYSTFSIVNFNLDAGSRVIDSGASNIIRQQLQQTSVLHVDETGININATHH
jgi:hypothetical protein